MHSPGRRVYPGTMTGEQADFLHSAEGLILDPATVVNEAPATGAGKRWANQTPANMARTPHLLGRSTTSPGKYYPFIWLTVDSGSSTTVIKVKESAHTRGIIVGDEVTIYDVTGSAYLTAQTVSVISADGLTVTVDTALSATPAEDDILVYYPNAGVVDATNMVVLWQPYSTDIVADEDMVLTVAFAGHFRKDKFPTFCSNTSVYNGTLNQRLTFYDSQL